MKVRLSPHGFESTSARRIRSIACATAVASVLLASCDGAPAPRPPAPIVPTETASSTAAPAPAPAAAPAASTPSAAAAAGVDPSKWRTSTSADDPAVIEVAGFRAPKPAAWIWTKPSMQFRTLQYTVPGGADSTLSADLIVSVFVAGDGGPIDANIERWRKQFRVGDGFAEPKRSSAEVGPLKVEYVELAGDYMAMGAPAIKKDQLQLGAIVQAEGRNVFFRLIGPTATVEANRADFMKLVEGLMPAD